MKKIICLLASVVIVLSLITTGAAAALANHEQNDIESTVENYLRTRMTTIYLGTATNSALSSPETLLDIVSRDKVNPSTREADESTVLTEALQQDMATFAEKNSPDVMASMDRAVVTLDDMLGDLQCMDDMVAYKNHVIADQGYTYTDFQADYYFGDITLNGDFAMVVAYEELNYHLSYAADPSYELGEFNVMLVKIGDDWVIADVASDDIAFLAYCKEGYDLDRELAAYDAAMAASTNADDTVESTETEISTLATSGNISYNQQNAVNYALTYTTSGDDGSGTPSFKNSRFHWFGADCMNFCSQAVWAGFGGSNSWADIPNHYGMDTVGSDTSSTRTTWWCDNTGGSGSWASCSAFRTYVSQSKSSSAKGLICDSASIGGGVNTLPYSASTLIGSVLHVEGYVNNIATAKAHAVFVNAATGTTRDKVMVCSYNRCRKNVPLSFVCAVGGSTKAVEAIAPKTFQGGESGLRLWGDLLNVIVTHTATRTISGHSNMTLANFEMTLMKPNGGIVKTWTAKNTNQISASYNNWDAVGEWIVKLTGTTSSGATATWYQAIRVV